MVRGMGFEPTNSLRDRILSPAQLTRLCYPRKKGNFVNYRNSIFRKTKTLFKCLGCEVVKFEEYVYILVF